MDIHQLNAICESLDDSSLFESGLKTAGKTARQVKQNLQAKNSNAKVKGTLNLIEQAVLSHPMVKSAAMPKKMARIMINRFDEGMSYGMHIDDPIISGCRTDLSFTLFLSDPEDYQGGELVISRHDGDEAVKLSKGSMILYPSSTLHAIQPVTSGTRLAAVGWIQSRIRSAEQREILFDLQQSLVLLSDKDENSSARMSLLKAKSNLMRRWAEV